MKSIIGSADKSVGRISGKVVELAKTPAITQLTSSDVISALTALAPTGAAVKGVGEASDVLGVLASALSNRQRLK
jgi:hypothetical protein